MKRVSTTILRLTVIFAGLLVLVLSVLSLRAAAIKGVVGDYRPILFGMSVAAIPFLMGVHQALKLLGYIDNNKAFTQDSVEALKKIKLCAFVISAFYAAGMPYIYIVADKDDAPGVILMGIVIIGATFVVGTAAGVFQRLLQNAIDIKSENDLTV